MLWECKEGCQLDQPRSKGHPGECEKHGRTFAYTKALKRTTDLRQVSQTSERRGRRRTSLKQGRGFAASPAQRQKVKGLPCIVCGCDGFETKVDPAHVYPRRLQSCDCAEGVVPLCRECHGRYDDQANPFDLLRHLVTRGYHAELVHVVAVHRVPIRELLDQVTGVKWAPAVRSEVTA